MTFFRTLILLSCLALASCGVSGIGYGVMLWSPSPSAIPHGSLVTIKSEARSEKQYTIAYGSREMQVDTWRVSFHHLRKEARAESDRFEAVENLFAESLKGDLPIRSSMDNYTNNNILYRLSENEIAKVVGEPSEELTVGNLTGRWYEILTQTGYRGFVFDYYLYVFDSQAQSDSGDDSLEVDPVKAKLNSWANKTWYPLYYSFMTRNRAIVLPLFNLSYGLAFLPHQKMILLTLPELQLQVSYLTTRSENVNDILFVEPDVHIEELNSGELRVRFSYQGKDYTENFIIFGGDIKALRDRQEKIQEKLWGDLSTRRKFTSPVAGELILNPDGTYQWLKGESLGIILPVSLGGDQGMFDLDKSMTSSLQGSYKGVLTLHPAEVEGQKTAVKPISFLLDYSDNFLQLIYVPSQNFEYDVVTKEEINNPSFTFNRLELSPDEENSNNLVKTDG